MNKLFDRRLYNLATALVIAILVLVPFHAFLTVGISSLVGHYTLVRLWEEFLLVVLYGLAIIRLVENKLLRQTLLKNRLVLLISVYVLFYVVAAVIAQTNHAVSLKAAGFAVVTDLRFLLWFVAILVLGIKIKNLHRLIFVPLFFVGIFALLQFFLLPHKILAHVGYNSLTNVAPEITINQSSNIIRVQSFLRGPNPLGAYLVFGICILVAIILKSTKLRTWALLAMSMVVLVLTFSRSAWLGLLSGLVTVLGLRSRQKRHGWAVVIVSAVLLMGALLGVFLVFRHNQITQDAFLHNHVGSNQIETSNEGHATAFNAGLHDVLHEPLGRGPGTAGPGSIYNNGHAPRNSENYFLQIGQELGWVGLVLFVAINIALVVSLWPIRQQPLVVGILGALVALTAVNQLSYAWTDESVSYLFWGVAALLLVPTLKKSHATTNDEKTTD